jgi:hypothetical protein
MVVVLLSLALEVLTVDDGHGRQEWIHHLPTKDQK